MVGPFGTLFGTVSDDDRAAFHEGTVASGVETSEEDIDDVLYG